jgi:hypothetical protein
MVLKPAAAPLPAIPDDDPAWLAALNAPIDDTPETEQEREDIAEAKRTGRFIPGERVSAEIARRVAEDR